MTFSLKMTTFRFLWCIYIHGYNGITRYSSTSFGSPWPIPQKTTIVWPGGCFVATPTIDVRLLQPTETPNSQQFLSVTDGNMPFNYSYIPSPVVTIVTFTNLTYSWGRPNHWQPAVFLLLGDPMATLDGPRHAIFEVAIFMTGRIAAYYADAFRKAGATVVTVVPIVAVLGWSTGEDSTVTKMWYPSWLSNHGFDDFDGLKLR